MGCREDWNRLDKFITDSAKPDSPLIVSYKDGVKNEQSFSDIEEMQAGEIGKEITRIREKCLKKDGTLKLRMVGDD